MTEFETKLLLNTINTFKATVLSSSEVLESELDAIEDTIINLKSLIRKNHRTIDDLYNLEENVKEDSTDTELLKELETITKRHELY